MIITKQLAGISDGQVTEEARWEAVDSGAPRIGLALSGGGFRAAIFHLGVIRRLEELGIMPKVRVISAVSGGSIISAYYLCEMERRLRLKAPEDRDNADVRIEIFEEIASDFFKALDNNLRTRALVYTPFYHPWLFIKTLFLKPFRAGARSELIQNEYDKWFYRGNTLDQLPSAAAGGKPKERAASGTRLLINTTSLLTGERVAFFREPISDVNEMSRVNRNVLPLSRVVGASSGVPGLFPPTMISGDVLVDGGVADNQGIESLIDDPVDCNVLLVSDASGQMEPIHTIKQGLVKVLSRVNSIFQFQVRNKLLDILVGWKRLPHLPERKGEEHWFAFVHLYLNLKDRQDVKKRVTSEFIPGIAGIRTDLDQFSFVEREALMYHGYTLIDAQIRKYCGEVLKNFIESPLVKPLATPPLFREDVLNTSKGRKKIRADLEAGKQNSYLCRCLKKYFWKIIPVPMAGFGLAAVCVSLVLRKWPQSVDRLGDMISGAVMAVTPNALIPSFDRALECWGLLSVETSVRGLSGIAAFFSIIFIVLYLLSFPGYVILRRVVSTLDRKVYKELTGLEPAVKWPSTDQKEQTAVHPQ